MSTHGVIAYHAIFGAYGFWLPNDPRGSWSNWVRKWELLRFGSATKTTERRSLANRTHDYQQRIDAKKVLKYPPVEFTGMQARSVARGFAKAIEDSGYAVHACSIMPDHVHMVVARHQRKIEQIVQHFKGAASKQLREEGLHPMQDLPKEDGALPTPWVRGRWKVYLNEPSDVRRAVLYTQQNPVKEGKRVQPWWFVTPYE